MSAWRVPRQNRTCTPSPCPTSAACRRGAEMAGELRKRVRQPGAPSGHLIEFLRLPARWSATPATYVFAPLLSQFLGRLQIPDRFHRAFAGWLPDRPPGREPPGLRLARRLQPLQRQTDQEPAGHPRRTGPGRAVPAARLQDAADVLWRAARAAGRLREEGVGRPHQPQELGLDDDDPVGDVPAVVRAVPPEDVQVRAALRSRPSPACATLWRLVAEVFSHPGYVVFYVVGMAIIGFHLWHGVSSALQSLGIDRLGWSPVLRRIGWTVAVGAGRRLPEHPALLLPSRGARS